MSKTNLLLVALVLGAVSLSCTFLRDKLAESSSKTKISPPANVPKFDPNAPLFSPGAEVVRRLAELDPSLAKFADAIEANERDAIGKSIAERQAAFKTVSNDVSRLGAPMIDDIRVASDHPDLYPASAMLMFQGDGSELIVRDPSLAGAMIGGLKNIWSESHTDAKNSGSIQSRKTTTKNGVTTTFGGKLAFREDGSSFFEMEIKTESVKDGVTLTTEMTGSVDGDECPNADGQVQLTIKLRLAGESGGAQVAQDLTVFVRATVNDNADLVGSTMDVVQGTRQVKNGRQMYVESGMTLTDDFAPGTERKPETSNEREIRSSQNVHENMENLNEASDLALDGYNAAYTTGLTVLYMARDKWQDGQCVQIVADPPGTVAVSSTTQIPVRVVHKFGGGEVPSKVDAVLSGEASVDPATIPKTAGSLNYVAPGETGKSAIIKLTATSRRGKATLDLNANTGGGSYQIVGGLDDFQTNSKVCDIMKPFTLTGGGFTNKFSGGMSGTYNFTGPFQSAGSGTYTISLPDGSGKPGTMTGQGTGSVLGGRFTRSGTEKYTLTPIEPCS